MTNDWHELTDLIGDRQFTVSEIRLDTGISIQGDFDLPPLARLRYEDQVFVSEFVRSHGSIKDMEKAFGISYPTVKNRLNRILDQLQLVEIEIEASPRAGRRSWASSSAVRSRRTKRQKGSGDERASHDPRSAHRLTRAATALPPVAACVPVVAAGLGARCSRAGADAARGRRAVPRSASATTTTPSCSRVPSRH